MGLLLFLWACAAAAGTAVGFGMDPDLQIDIITELDLVNTTLGVTQVSGLHNASRAFLFQDTEREIHAAPHVSEKLVQLFRNKSKFTFLATLQQKASTSGVILSIRELEHRQGYEELERQLKEVYKERSNILHQLSKTSKELQGIKVNLQSLKNDEASTKTDMQKLLELGQNQREMKSFQEAFQKQLNEAAEKAEKQQATINFLKTEMERKSKIIRDLQNENKSLKNKLLSGNKLCVTSHAEESKKIQSQLKELRNGKKDLIFKAQQLTDLEQKLSVAKGKLENAALDKESQLKALKETAQLCLSSVLHSQPPTMNVISSKAAEKLTSSNTTGSKVPFQVTSTKVWKNVSAEKENFHVALKKEENQGTQECDSQDVTKTCLGNRNNSKPRLKAAEAETSFQELHSPPWINLKIKSHLKKKEKNDKESVSTAGKIL